MFGSRLSNVVLGRGPQIYVFLCHRAVTVHGDADHSRMVYYGEVKGVVSTPQKEVKLLSA